MNRQLPCVCVLPEDRKDELLANGFVNYYKVDARRIQIERPIGGYTRFKDKFEDTYSQEMQLNRHQYMVLLVDFDEQDNRLETIKQAIPAVLQDRVFIPGAWSNPERLSKALSMGYEQIGEALAKECDEKAFDLWNHELLRHNEAERIRMAETLTPILFSQD